MNSRRILTLMVLCLLVAAALRLPGLHESPPVIHYDEAANVIIAGDIGLRGQRPIFITSYTGKEVLFFYLAGGLMRLIGESVFTLRLTAAYVALLTVAATYWLGRELLGDRRMALIATGLLAVSFWHLIFSRYGFRAIGQPLLQALTVATLLRGLRRNDWRWLATGGLFLGLSAYTYLAARLFPLLLAVASLPLLFTRETYRRRRRQLALVVTLSAVVLSPLLYHFWHHPETFWVRIGQVAPGGQGAGLSLIESYLRSLAMFFIAGDPYERFNLPGRPIFDWFWGGLFVAGWILCLPRLRTLAYDWQRAATLLLIFAPLLMILPTALAAGEIVPSNLRAIGLLPFVYYLPAVGLVLLIEDVANRYYGINTSGGSRLDRIVSKTLSRFKWRFVNLIGIVAFLLILVAGGGATRHIYFQAWTTRADVYYASDADLAAVARYLNETAEPDQLSDETIYVAAVHYRHPTVALLSHRYEAVKWLPRSQALIFPPTGTARYVYPHSSPLPAWAETYLSSARPIAGPTGPDGQPVFVAYELADLSQPSLPDAFNVNFGHLITLLGYEVKQATAGESLPVTLTWRIEARPATNYIPFVHLEDAWRYRWSQAEPFAYPSEQWTPGEIIVQRVEVPVRAGTPPGNYRLRIGLFNPESGQRLPQLDGAGRYAGDSFVIEEAAITVAATPVVPSTPPFALTQFVQPGLRLLGYERGGAQVSAGEAYWLALWWQSTTALPHMRTRLELVRPDSIGVILLTTQPVHNTYPFHQWMVPQFVIDHLAPKIPESLPPGDYRLQLRMLSSDDRTLFTTDLGPLAVVATERIFTRPATSFPMAATFGNEIKLAGYDLGAVAAPDDGHPRRFSLSLVWQALTEPTADYTVFVHLLNPDGTCCLWQQDVMPGQGSYPTGRWLTGEFVRDTYEIALPEDVAAGLYPLEVGLYLAETGQRLRFTIPDQPDGDALYLRPLQLQ